MLYDQSLIDDELIREPLPDLEKIQAKTLLLWGRDDRFNPSDIGIRMLSLLPNAQMHIFSQCGHRVQQEHADEFNRPVIDFLTH